MAPVSALPGRYRVYSYNIYGGCFESEIDFPELRASEPGTADWRLRIAERPAPITDPVLVGEERLLEHVVARLYRCADRFRLTFDDTGTFDVSLDGRDLAWTPAAGADHELARIDLVGRVLSLAIHAGGDICLHASAVSIEGRAIAFLAPKGYGKSTLAASMLGVGARLLTDDTLRLRLGPRLIAAPGAFSIRLRGDAAKHLQRPASDEGDGKVRIEDWRDDELFLGEAPVDALYLLAPVVPTPERAPVARRRLKPIEAMLCVAQQGKIALLLGKSEGCALARRVAALAATVPVYRLEVARTLGRLPDVVEQLNAWHCAGATELNAAMASR